MWAASGQTNKLSTDKEECGITVGSIASERNYYIVSA